MKKITEMEPKALWRHFDALCNIPRPSKHEAQVIAHLKAQAESWGLQTIVDDIGNLIIRKPATPGREGSRGIILQSHVDMVPQKSQFSDHDFVTDPIQIWIDGEWLKAKGTTLGADNGIGVAAIMAVLEDDSLDHGPLEALLTIDEEAGMTGAKNLQADILRGEILLNLDSEDEGEFFIGCAGGVDLNVSMDAQEHEWPINSRALKMTLSGLRGGHSGVDIHRQRENANLLLMKVLKPVLTRGGVQIAALKGGSLRNAIPREAEVVLAVPNIDFDKVLDALNQSWISEHKMLIDKEPKANLLLEAVEKLETVADDGAGCRWLDAVIHCPNGVIAMSATMADVVETSSNFARFELSKGQFIAACLLRSSDDAARDQLSQSISEHFALIAAGVSTGNGYPGWQPNYDSALLKNMQVLYKKEFGRKAAVKVIHAGLECGLFGRNYPDWDMISFGPDIRYPHSPDEKVHIGSVERFWHFLKLSLR